MEQLKKAKILTLETLQKDLSQKIPQEIWHIDYDINQVFLTDMMQGDDLFIEVVDPVTFYWCVTGHNDAFSTIDEVVEFTAYWFDL